jgi:hypothetical protein
MFREQGRIPEHRTVTPREGSEAGVVDLGEKLKT